MNEEQIKLNLPKGHKRVINKTNQAHLVNFNNSTKDKDENDTQFKIDQYNFFVDLNDIYNHHLNIISIENTSENNEKILGCNNLMYLSTREIKTNSELNKVKNQLYDKYLFDHPELDIEASLTK